MARESSFQNIYDGGAYALCIGAGKARGLLLCGLDTWLTRALFSFPSFFWRSRLSSRGAAVVIRFACLAGWLAGWPSRVSKSGVAGMKVPSRQRRGRGMNGRCHNGVRECEAGWERGCWGESGINRTGDLGFCDLFVKLFVFIGWGR